MLRQGEEIKCWIRLDWIWMLTALPIHVIRLSEIFVISCFVIDNDYCNANLHSKELVHEYICLTYRIHIRRHDLYCQNLPIFYFLIDIILHVSKEFRSNIFLISKLSWTVNWKQKKLKKMMMNFLWDRLEYNIGLVSSRLWRFIVKKKYNKSSVNIG